MHLRKLCLTLTLVLIGSASNALANSITITATAVPVITLDPSSDSLSLNAGTAILTAPGEVAFQAGSFYLGNSPIPDQNIPISFTDTITINNITRVLTFYGSDNVTAAADTVSIFAGAPVNFGNYIFALNSWSYEGTTIGQTAPISLYANVSNAPVPEPASLALLATGVVGALMMRGVRFSLFAR